MLSVECLQRGEFQPRDNFHPDALNELAQSIASQGIIQPLVVRKVTARRYEIIAGERRWQAAKIAGLLEVPVIIRSIDNHTALAIGIIENIQRESLTPLEEANALQQLSRDFQMTHQQIAQVVGKSRASVSNSVRLLQLNEAVKVELNEGKLEMGHARALLSLDAKTQLRLAKRIIHKSLSVRQTEDLVKQTLNPAPKTAPPTPSPAIETLRDALSQTLSTTKVAIKVEIKDHNAQGKIIIHYRSKDALDAILAHIH